MATRRASNHRSYSLHCVTLSTQSIDVDRLTEVGEGIKASGVPRSEIFLTSKIWATYMGRISENLDLILANLDTDYLDLLLIHWPFALNPEGKLSTTGPQAQVPFREKDGKPVPDVVEDWDLTETWRQMEAVQMSGEQNTSFSMAPSLLI